MPSPFAGMDPYLEHPRSGPNFHHRLIAAIAIHLGPQLRPKYRIVVEEAMYQTGTQDSVLVGIPDVAVQKSARARQGDTVAVGSGVAIAATDLRVLRKQTTLRSTTDIIASGSR